MAGEIELFKCGEDADADAFSVLDGGGTALNEGGLREVELACNGLHFLCAEAGGVKHNGERIAIERCVGEYVNNEIIEFHYRLHLATALHNYEPKLIPSGDLRSRISRNAGNWQGNPRESYYVSLGKMEQRYSWSWIEARVVETVRDWNECARRPLPHLMRFTREEQRDRENAYDDALRKVETEACCNPRTASERLQIQQRVVDTFPSFATVALGLKPEAVELISNVFLRAGTDLARWARSFDPGISVPDTIQACRNMWTACGLQGLLGQPMQFTPSLAAYSLLYPYSDNYLDDPSLARKDKLHFSERFRKLLVGQRLPARDQHEANVWAMVQLIEEQFPRRTFPQVFDSLLAIHRAQEQSVAQLGYGVRVRGTTDNREILRISCAKGGTSVLADACLANPHLTEAESLFAFKWGVLLQLGDDLQDVKEDLRRGSATLFTQAAIAGQPLDNTAKQLFNFGEQVGGSLRGLPHGSELLKDLIQMSWRSLVLKAIADASSHFSKSFLAEVEPNSAFRFDFLRQRNKNLAAREWLHARLFDAFLETSPGTSRPSPRISSRTSTHREEPLPHLQAALSCMD